MSREEFLHRWDALPNVKRAELIEGIVHVPSPVSRDHASREIQVGWWLTHYAYLTPGCATGTNSTWLMCDSSPQPDVYLRILPECGGQSHDAGPYPEGAPELVAEICVTSTTVDFGSKLALYRRAGVREYITVEVLSKRIVWRTLEDGEYVIHPPDADGILRSNVFPGLWLDTAAFWADDGPRMLVTLQAGIEQPAHRAFVKTLAR